MYLDDGSTKCRSRRSLRTPLTWRGPPQRGVQPLLAIQTLVNRARQTTRFIIPLCAISGKPSESQKLWECLYSWVQKCFFERFAISCFPGCVFLYVVAVSFSFFPPPPLLWMWPLASVELLQTVGRKGFRRTDTMLWTNKSGRGTTTARCHFNVRNLEDNNNYNCQLGVVFACLKRGIADFRARYISRGDMFYEVMNKFEILARQLDGEIGQRVWQQVLNEVCAKRYSGWICNFDLPVARRELWLYYKVTWT